jgi:hypothetical protein
MDTLRLGSPWLLLPLLALACRSGAGQATPPPPDAGSPDTLSQADLAPRNLTPDSAEDRPAPPADAAPRPEDTASLPFDAGDRVGVVELLLHDRNGSESGGYRLTATFGPGARGCEERGREGGCVFEDCPARGPFPVAPSAGLITVSGTTVPISAAPGAGGTYETAARGEIFKQGDLITIRAAGAEVPGFEVQLTAPSTTDVYHPNYDPGAINTFGRHEALEVRALGYAGGRLEGLLADAWKAPFRAVRCVTEPDRGLILFPTNGIATLRGTDEGRLRVHSISRTEVVVGGWRIQVTVAQAMQKTGWWIDYDYKMRIPCDTDRDCWPGFRCADYFACIER